MGYYFDVIFIARTLFFKIYVDFLIGENFGNFYKIVRQKVHEERFLLLFLVLVDMKFIC